MHKTWGEKRRNMQVSIDKKNQRRIRSSWESRSRLVLEWFLLVSREEKEGKKAPYSAAPNILHCILSCSNGICWELEWNEPFLLWEWSVQYRKRNDAITDHYWVILEETDDEKPTKGSVIEGSGYLNNTVPGHMGKLLKILNFLAFSF
jgi:hypothetical protein